MCVCVCVCVWVGGGGWVGMHARERCEENKLRRSREGEEVIEVKEEKQFEKNALIETDKGVEERRRSNGSQPVN